MDQTSSSVNPTDRSAIESPGVFIGMLVLLALFLTLAITDCYFFVWVYRKITGKKKPSIEEESIETTITTEKNDNSKHVTFATSQKDDEHAQNTQSASQSQDSTHNSESAAAGPGH